MAGLLMEKLLSP